jgi:hypothetical protein
MGYTFLAEMLQMLPRNNQYIIIADAGPIGTAKCANLLAQLEFKFLLSISGSKQIKGFSSHIKGLSKGKNFFFFN